MDSFSGGLIATLMDAGVAERDDQILQRKKLNLFTIDFNRWVVEAWRILIMNRIASGQEIGQFIGLRIVS